MNFWKDVEKDRNAKEYEATLENLDVEFTIERTLEYNDYIREVGHRRRQVMATSINVLPDGQLSIYHFLGCTKTN
ncbi:hypothetical protein RhiirA5_409059 [Rhizophagus irregularis]|uniref:Uncharacterized protein n=1 Tax=Rhizophagus irregularis TaxID=588596 RepID=A0A2N0RDN5_9GLOM|nr:hypothetical protein RhiirA5_409059 [Rhizophagus irregularis]PKC61417.1 hypothetical protein RhiirA1_466584 [Rhizophagus irregularis]CAG8561329.1 10399_t:CDS:2 [Rhizophagus irregularis]